MDHIEVDWEALHALDEQTKQGNPGAAVLALYYRQAATRAITTALIPWDGQEEWTAHIQKADEDMQVALTYVRQHAYAAWVGRGQQKKELLFFIR
ncbi:MAG: hypothetical protein ACYCOU_26565, partial [Sulfobacillus sp.]